MRVLYWATISTLLMAVVSCTPQDEKENPFPVGIWQGTYQDQPISIEFRKDGRAFLVSGGEDAIVLAVYSIDLRQKSGHLDIEFRNQSWKHIATLIKQTGPNTLRIQHFKDGTARPPAFTQDAIVLYCAKSHVLPRIKTAEERDREMRNALIMDTIRFGGEKHEELLRICEATFRYQFEHNASGAQQNAAAYFLSIGGKDLPKALLDRFRGHSPPVKQGSQFQVGNGLKFRIVRISWLDDINVEVGGGYYEGNVSSSGNTYHLRRKDGTWKVISFKRNWIS